MKKTTRHNGNIYIVNGKDAVRKVNLRKLYLEALESTGLIYDMDGIWYVGQRGDTEVNTELLLDKLALVSDLVNKDSEATKEPV